MYCSAVAVLRRCCCSSHVFFCLLLSSHAHTHTLTLPAPPPLLKNGVKPIEWPTAFYPPRLFAPPPPPRSSWRALRPSASSFRGLFFATSSRVLPSFFFFSLFFFQISTHLSPTARPPPRSEGLRRGGKFKTMQGFCDIPSLIGGEAQIRRFFFFF